MISPNSKFLMYWFFSKTRDRRNQQPWNQWKPGVGTSVSCLLQTDKTAYKCYITCNSTLGLWVSPIDEACRSRSPAEPRLTLNTETSFLLSSRQNVSEKQHAKLREVELEANVPLNIQSPNSLKAEHLTMFLRKKKGCEKLRTMDVSREEKKTKRFSHTGNKSTQHA